jgi:hypothetical protein
VGEKVGALGRFGRLAAAALIVASATTGCVKADDRDCGWSITWRHTVYLGLGYVLGATKTAAAPLTDADIKPVTPGKRLGEGRVPRCPGDDGGAPTTVFAIRDIDPAVAVVTRSLIIGVARGHAVPSALVKKP